MGTGTTGSISAEEDEGYGGKIHSAKSASLTVSHTLTMNQKLRVGESLDNELTAMFTLNPSEIRPFFKGQGYHSNLGVSRTYKNFL